jgi:hypothetical protein
MSRRMTIFPRPLLNYFDKRMDARAPDLVEYATPILGPTALARRARWPTDLANDTDRYPLGRRCLGCLVMQPQRDQTVHLRVVTSHASLRQCERRDRQA